MPGSFGTNDTQDGVVGTTNVSGKSGVFGLNPAGGGNGVAGISDAGNGIFGKSKSLNGVFGESESGSGLHGRSVGQYGIYGFSEQGAGIRTESKNGVGLEASSESSVAIRAHSRKCSIEGLTHSRDENAIFGMNAASGTLPGDLGRIGGSGVWGHTKVEAGTGVVGSVEPGLTRAAGVTGIGPVAGRFFGDVEINGRLRLNGQETLTQIWASIDALNMTVNALRQAISQINPGVINAPIPQGVIYIDGQRDPQTGRYGIKIKGSNFAGGKWYNITYRATNWPAGTPSSAYDTIAADNGGQFESNKSLTADSGGSYLFEVFDAISASKVTSKTWTAP